MILEIKTRPNPFVVRRSGSGSFFGGYLRGLWQTWSPKNVPDPLSLRERLPFVLIVMVCLSTRLVAQDDVKPTPAEQLARTFSKLDRNNNQRLSLDEFLTHRTAKAQPDVAKRDFRLFDLDADGELRLEEFSTVPIVVPVERRGPLPDPLLLLVDQAVIAMDKSFDDWDTKPDVEIDVNQFISAFASTLGMGITRTMSGEADANGDRRVSRDEAERFLEIQLGVRRSDGQLLREPNGRVCNLMLYEHIDLNHNDRLERTEFVKRCYLPEKSAAELFDQGDSNRDGALSFDEWFRLPSHAMLDPVNEFRRMDTNLDTRVDPKELMAATPEWKKNLAAHVFPGFDMDRDGTLTLEEYRLTMLANQIHSWQKVIRDANADGQLTFKEFQFGSFQFPLLRWFYFQRFDLNGDQKLDTDEFFFQTRKPDAFFLLNEDGQGWRLLCEIDGFPECGSPAVSPDGKQIAFDAWKLAPRGPSTLFVMNINGTHVRTVCTGMMPTWSKDGRQFAFSRQGVQIVNIDGTDEQIVNRNGWGAQWSPDGQWIALTERNTIKTYDVKTKTFHTVLEANAHPYQQIYWNMTWSPDNTRLCFKAKKADGTMEIATVKVIGNDPQLKVHFSKNGTISPDSAWHPDGDRIVFPMYCPERRRSQLYEINPNQDGPPRLVKGQDPNRSNSDCCWTPDGKYLIVVSGGF